MAVGGLDRGVCEMWMGVLVVMAVRLGGLVSGN